MSRGDLAGRVALVTGSTAGIGRAVAGALASRGASIVAHGIEPEQAVRFARSGVTGDGKRRAAMSTSAGPRPLRASSHR